MVPLRRWAAVYFVGPDCYQHLRADQGCLRSKIKDGRAFWAGARVLWCICCEHAEMVLVEQQDTIFNDFFMPSDVPGCEVREHRTTHFGDEEDKVVRFTTRNLILDWPVVTSLRRPR